MKAASASASATATASTLRSAMLTEMQASRSSLAAERFQLALSLYELAESMFRQKLRRTQPEASEEEIDKRVLEWQQRRPGAEFGDAEGQPVVWPRRKE